MLAKLRLSATPAGALTLYGMARSVPLNSTLSTALGLAMALSACGGGGDSDPPGGGDQATDSGAGGGGDATEGQPDAGSFQEEGGPVFLSIGTNVSELTEGESVVFTAVLTDPDGIDDVIGGSLKNISKDRTFGAFSTSGQEGSYQLNLSWAQFDQVESLEFEGDHTRTFIAEFFDVSGKRAEQPISLTYHCDGLGGSACGGTCVDRMVDGDNCGGCGHTCAVGGCGLGRCVFALQEWGPDESCNSVCATWAAGEGFTATCTPSCTHHETYNSYMSPGGTKARGYQRSCQGPGAGPDCEDGKHPFNTTSCSEVVPDEIDGGSWGIMYMTNDNCCCEQMF